MTSRSSEIAHSLNLAPGSFDARCNVGILGAIPQIATDFDNRQSCDAVYVDHDGSRYAYASGTSFALTLWYEAFYVPLRRRIGLRP